VAVDTTFNAAVVLATQVMAASSQFACTIAPAMACAKMAGVFVMRVGVDRVVFKRLARTSATVVAYAIMASANVALHGRAHHARLRVSHVSMVPKVVGNAAGRAYAETAFASATKVTRELTALPTFVETIATATVIALALGVIVPLATMVYSVSTNFALVAVTPTERVTTRWVSVSVIGAIVVPIATQ